VFYSIKSLPSFWQAASHLNPFFYMIDGFRYGFFGQSDTPPMTSLIVMLIANAAVTFIALSMLKRGYKMRH
jgi:ABC-2 type transport system permease protein